jgi:DNA end-binding protein Ku
VSVALIVLSLRRRPVDPGESSAALSQDVGEQAARNVKLLLTRPVLGYPRADLSRKPPTNADLEVKDRLVGGYPGIMRSVWKGTLTVGKVAIPVAMHKAGEHDHPTFKSLHKECGTPVEQDRVCRSCDVTLEPGYSETMRGFEIAENQFVTIENDELEAALGGKVLELDRFVDGEQLGAAYASTAYWLAPGKSEFARRAYATLRQALWDSGLVGLGRLVYFTKEHVACVWPDEEGLLGLTTLYVGSELRDVGELRKQAARVETVKAEVELMTQAIQQRVRTVGPVLSGRAYKRRLLGVLNEKAKSGQTIAVAAPPAAATVDLADALSRSIRKPGRTKSAA